MQGSLFLLAVLLCGYATAQTTISATGCGGEFKEVRVGPCDSQPCKFRKGQTTTIEVDFVSNQDSSSLKLSVMARVLGKDISFPGMEAGSNGCQGLGLTCPIQKGQAQTMKLELKVPDFSPTIKTTATFKIEGDGGVVFCVRAPVSVE